jgi:nicotinate-nucleotide pyrophosphorylase (carboxylating)
MTREDLNWKKVDLIIENALTEDIGNGDITTDLLFPKDVKCKAIIKAKEDGILAGLPVCKRIFRTLNF